MNMKRLLAKNEKGISPVLAVLLMIAVAVAASLVTYAWVMGYLGTTTARAGRAIQIQSVAFDAGVDEAFGTGDDDEVTIYMQNVGQGTVKPTDIYIDGTIKTISCDGLDIDYDEGDTATLVISGQSFIGGESIQIKVTCIDGTFTESSSTVE